jgi:NTP pyrophosphatase (non-canonical NTP hydrolase)
MLSDITIKQAQEEVRRFIDAQGKDWSQIDNHFYVFTHLSEETGELARHVINVDFKIYERETSLKKARKGVLGEKAISQIEDDLGDILYHLCKLAIAYDIDLNEAFQKAMNKIKKRYGRD